MNYTEIIGYLASLGVLVSFMMKDMRQLRMVNTMGCCLFILYGYLLHYSFPIIITNVCIVGINMYYLMKKN